MKKLKIVVVIVGIAFAVSCISAKITKAASLLPGGLKIAVAPGGGAMADSIGITLFKRGYLIVEAAQMANLLERANIPPADLMKMKGLEFLRQRGFDAVLAVQAVMRSDGIPKSAVVNFLDVATGGKISGVSWKNGRAGTPGSPADRSMRSTIPEAAQQIVDALVKGNN
jgi:hypothetical protein